jgi:hypothetical protein
VYNLLKIREEIEKLASGHISHGVALRLEKIPISPLFFQIFLRLDGKQKPDTFKLRFDASTVPEGGAGVWVQG